MTCVRAGAGPAPAEGVDMPELTTRGADTFRAPRPEPARLFPRAHGHCRLLTADCRLPTADQILRNNFLLYIQYRVSQYTPSTATPSTNGAGPAPKLSKMPCPRCVLNDETMKPSQRCAMR